MLPNKKGDRLGFDNLVKFIKRQENKKDLIKKIVKYVDRFSKGSDRADDLTLMEITMLGGDSK